MDNTVQLALIAIIAPTLAAVSAFVIGVLNSGKLNQIHTLTNSQLSRLTSSLEVANEKIVGLEKLIQEMDDNRKKSIKKEV